MPTLSTARYHARVPQDTPPPNDRLAPPSPIRQQIPNALTCLRIALAALLIVVLSLADFRAGSTARPLMWVALIAFVVAALSDALDGMLARKWQVISRFGRVMDPFADKVLVLGAFVLLAGAQLSVQPEPGKPFIQLSGVAPWMVMVILGRDLLVTSLRGMVEGAGGSFAAISAGKIKMVVQSVAIPIILLTLAVANDPASGPARTIILVCAWAATLVTAWSAIPYTMAGFAKLKELES